MDQVEQIAKRLKRGFKPAEVTAKITDPLRQMLPMTVEFRDGRLQPRLTKYVIKTPYPKQEHFLMLDEREVFYGGAGFGGKSFALLMAALQFVDIPGYNALLIRRTFKELNKPEALLDLAHKWLAQTDARWRGDKNRYEFPSGATLTFGYMEHEGDKYQYTGVNWQFIGFDEVTQFTESQYSFLFGWLRKTADNPVPLRLRSASNPIGPGRLWAKERFVDPTARGDPNAPGFVPATIRDNLSADEAEYMKSVEHMDPITKAQILAGDWEAQTEGTFRRHWFPIKDAISAGLRLVRYWDLAATEAAPGKDPSWTVGALVGSDAGLYYICDIKRDRLTPRNVEKLIEQTAKTDGQAVKIRMEQEPGSSGVGVIDYYTKLLAGYDFKGDKVTGPKEIRVNALACQAEAKNVFLLVAFWNKEFLDEIQVFPGGGHDDQVIAASGAFNELVGRPQIDTSRIVMVGERLRPDW